MKILIIIASLIFIILIVRLFRNNTRSKTPLQQKSRPYDIFISYNTASSIKVRKIVDYLLSNGLKVWFAEYLISLDNQYNEDKFREQYLDGIKQSKLCLIFKNEYYQNSQYCQEEFLKISEVHKTSDVITLLLDDIEHDLANEQTIRLDYKLEPIFNLVSQKLNQKLVFPESRLQFFQGDFYDMNHISHLFQFDRTGWKATNKDTSYLKKDKYDTVGHELMKIIDNTPVKLLFSVGRDAQSSVRHNDNTNFIDDRAFRQEMVEWSEKHFKGRQHLKQTGIHLFFHNNKSHNVYTYYHRNSWIRRYSLIDFYPKWPDKNFEFVFHFSIYGSFRQYCGIAPYLDRMVETLNFYTLN